MRWFGRPGGLSMLDLASKEKSVTHYRLAWVAFLLALSGAASCRHAAPPEPADSSNAKTKWLDPSSVHPSPIQHERLTAPQMKRIKRLQETFHDVDPSPAEKWVEDFKRDRDPEREIRIFEGMAQPYRAYCSQRKLTLDAKKDVYQVVLLRSGAPDSEVLPHLQLKALSIDDAKNILKQYK